MVFKTAAEIFRELTPNGPVPEKSHQSSCPPLDFVGLSADQIAAALTAPLSKPMQAIYRDSINSDNLTLTCGSDKAILTITDSAHGNTTIAGGPGKDAVTFISTDPNAKLEKNLSDHTIRLIQHTAAGLVSITLHDVENVDVVLKATGAKIQSQQLS